MTTKKEEKFIRAVMRALIRLGWSVRDDGRLGMPDDLMKSELADAIIKNLHILK
jgi:hypothetical protein